MGKDEVVRVKNFSAEIEQVDIDDAGRVSLRDDAAAQVFLNGLGEGEELEGGSEEIELDDGV